MSSCYAFQGKGEYLKSEVNKLERNCKNKNFRDFYQGISDIKKGHQPTTNTVKVRELIWLQTPTVF
jgi:hypothetical protein